MSEFQTHFGFFDFNARKYDENGLREAITKNFLKQGFKISWAGLLISTIEEWRVFWQIYDEATEDEKKRMGHPKLVITGD